MGVIEHNPTVYPGEGQTMEILNWFGWMLREEVILMPPFDECLILLYIVFLMNVLIWNCKGALKPTFQSHVRELIRIHNLAILVLMETKVGGERAREITDRLLFDSVIHTDTIAYAGGFWML